MEAQMTTTNKHLLDLADRTISDGAPTWSFEVRHGVKEAFLEAAELALKSGNLEEAIKLIDAALLVFPSKPSAANDICMSGCDTAARC